jgi:hypothetical protein
LIDCTDAAFTPSNGLSVVVPTNENSGGRKQYIAICDSKTENPSTKRIMICFAVSVYSDQMIWREPDTIFDRSPRKNFHFEYTTIGTVEYDCFPTYAIPW